MHFGIRTKFLLLVGLLLMTIFAGITFFQIHNNTSALRQDLREESTAFATLATEPIGSVYAIYKDSGTSKIQAQLDEFSVLNDNVTNIAIVNINGQAGYSQHMDQSPEVSKDEASSFEPIYKNNNAGTLNAIIYPYFEASGAHRFSVVYTISDQAIEDAIKQQTRSLLYFGIASLTLTAVLTYLLINRIIIKPIKHVSEQAGIISAGNLEQQISVKNQDEIGSLGESVNRMAESLKADIAKLKEVDKVKSEFMMITSHNLRTPLSIINGFLENMKYMNDITMIKNGMSKIGASAKRLDVFAEDILTISQFELGNVSLQAEDSNISEFVKQIVDEFVPTAALKALKVQTEIADISAKVKISKPHIRSAIWNILDNATKFTPQGGSISIKLSQNDGKATLAISDTGIGIKPQEMSKLFTKFHRGTSTLNYDYEGTGIGLYSSKMIVERHGGSIEAQSQEGQGSIFTITLPISTSTASTVPDQV